MKRIALLAFLAIAWIAAPSARAQFETGFEPPTYTGDADGEELNGQDTFFNPNPAASVSFLVHTYAGNPLGISPPPTGGGDQFALGIGPGGGFFCRSQRPAVYGDGTGAWKVEFDVLVTYTGSLPSAQNVGSFSTQDYPGDQTAIMLSRWEDPNTAALWKASMVWNNSAGSDLTEDVPNDAFRNLALNVWHHWWMSFDLDSNLITEVGIRNLDTGVEGVYNPTDRYLDGGAAGGPPPDGLRLFAGTSTIAGNTLAFDNLKIARPGLCASDGCGTFNKMICRSARSKVIMKGTGTAGLDVELTYDGAGECTTVKDTGKWKVVKKNQAAGEHTASACGTDKSCTL